MNGQRTSSKKRKGSDLEADRTLYGSFVHAANAVSQLYTAAVQQNKRSEEQGARQALERVAQFVVKEYGNASAVPTAVLMEVLRQELQAAQGSAAAIPMPFPVPLLPTAADSSDALSDDEHLMSAEPTPGSFRRTASGHQISPPKPRGGAGQLPTMFHQQQQMQQQQQQLQHMQQQHQQMVQQQQQQQQQAGFIPGGFGGQNFQ